METDLEIVALGCIALSGCAVAVNRCKEQLNNRFREDLLEKVVWMGSEYATFCREDFSEAEAFIAAGRGGIFAALWDIAEELNSGLYVNLKSIPVYQETIEICNYLDINPYELESKGMYLLAVKKGYEFCEKMRNNGHIAEIIGNTTDSNDRIVMNGELIRYIEKNRGKDEIERIK